MDLNAVAQLLLGQVGVVTLLILAFGMGVKKIWVWGYQLKDEQERVQDKQKESDAWRDRFLAAMELNQVAASTVEKAVSAITHDSSKTHTTHTK